MQCLNICRVLRYHNPNKYRFQEKYTYHLLFTFFSILIRKRLFWKAFVHILGQISWTICHGYYQWKPIKVWTLSSYGWQCVWKIQFKICWQPSCPWLNLKRWNRWTYINCRYKSSWAELSSSRVQFAIRRSAPKTTTDFKIAANIKSFNKKQLLVFDVLHQWARNYVRNVSSK